MSNLYIRLRTGFYSHRKTLRLRRIIGDDAFWLPPRVWAYAAENQPDGDLSHYTAEDLAYAIGYTKDASSMLQALKDCGFIDEKGHIHDWQTHNNYHVAFKNRAKAAAEARWKKENTTEKEEKDIDIDIEIEQASLKHCSKHCLTNASSIIDCINAICGRQFSKKDCNIRPIAARLSEKGVTVEGIKLMLNRQWKLWGDKPEMVEYFRPETLFRPSKFESYYAARECPVEQPNGSKQTKEPRQDELI